MAPKGVDSSRNTIPEVPALIRDASQDKVYQRKKFLGKGSFAKCYEFMDLQTKATYAAKTLHKQTALNARRKDKIEREIQIHAQLKHKNLVRLYGYFEDQSFFYLVMELCCNKSMAELLKRRKTITEFECRYYMTQIVEGVEYLHERNIVHRDLKLENLFLDSKLQVKIGDFGFAIRLEDQERRKTLCGTPTYMAPEILHKAGYAFECDIWSLGCIMFTLLVGQTPFYTKALKAIYEKIKTADYKIPMYVSREAAAMIAAMLKLEPELRPTIKELKTFEFLFEAKIPKTLATSCLTIAPIIRAKRKAAPVAHEEAESLDPESSSSESNSSVWLQVDYKANLENLYDQLSELMEDKTKLLDQTLEDFPYTDKTARPQFFITKWVDYSEKYGFAYELSDESMGVLFNDATTLLLMANKKDCLFIDREGKRTEMPITKCCTSLEKKVKLLKYFRNYMVQCLDSSEHVYQAALTSRRAPIDLNTPPPQVLVWQHAAKAALFFLTSGVVQVNWTSHVKVILCPEQSSVTYIDPEEGAHTYRFRTLLQRGCPKLLFQKMRFAYRELGKMLQQVQK